MSDTLERRQLPLYLAALAAGCVLGLAWPAAGGGLEVLLWPALAVLLYATFTQVDLLRLGAALGDRRFLGALLVANFVAVPALVWVLTRPLSGRDDVLLFAVLVVLLAPCIDWFVPFVRAGGGDAVRAIGATPVLLAGQMVALPAYLVLFLGTGAADVLSAGPFVEAFVGLILLPLGLAALTQLWWAHSTRGRRMRAGLGVVPVPALAVVLLIVAASQIDELRGAGGELAAAGAVYLAYVLAVPFIGRLVARGFALGAPAARTLVFSVGTRNSFVVLPLALGLEEGAALAAAVIVLQSLVELTAMSGYVRLVPRRLIPDERPGP